MYHLVFQSDSKHKQKALSYYRRSKASNPSSTHNQFELETIRGSIKSRWELFGAGDLPFQRRVWDIEGSSLVKAPNSQLHTYFNGHIITLENPADAMWFRLNFENVTKNGCRLVEMYKDLDTDEIIRLADVATEKWQVHQQLQNDRRYLTNTAYQIGCVRAESVYLQHEKLADIIGNIRRLTDDMQDQIATVTDRVYADYAGAAEELFDYICKHRTVIA